eukprot:SAG11_NODE_3035_length_2748_cov_3.895432_1_plen_149_part_10
MKLTGGARALEGMSTAEEAPSDLALGMGQSAKYMIVVPSQRLAAVTLGLSWSSSGACPLGDYPLGRGATFDNGSRVPAAWADLDANSEGYDDSWSSTQFWRSFGNVSRLMRPGLAGRRGGRVVLAPRQSEDHPRRLAARRPAPPREGGA